MKSFAVVVAGAFCFAVGCLVCSNSSFPREIGGLEVATVVRRYKHMFHEQSHRVIVNDRHSRDGALMRKQSLRRASYNHLENNRDARGGLQNNDIELLWHRALDDTNSSNTTDTNTTDTNTTAAPTGPQGSETAVPLPAPSPPDTDRFSFFSRGDGRVNGHPFDCKTILSNEGYNLNRYGFWVDFRNEGHEGQDRFRFSAVYRFMDVQLPTNSPTVPGATPSPTPQSSSISKIQVDW